MLEIVKKKTEWLYRFLASKELTIALFGVICLCLAITTFTEAYSTLLWTIIRLLFALILIGLSLCTLQRIKHFTFPVLLIHIGVILTFIGGVISSYGFVATVNIYEGSSVDKVFRWDIEKDVSLGVDIFVEKLHEEYYPVPVKVGVLKGDEKHGLILLKTGEKFELGTYGISVNSLELYKKKLNLSVFNDGEYIGDADTSGQSDLPPDFPFDFKLVAYQDPVIKKMWVDMKLIRDGQIVSEGSTRVNSPLNWDGLNFYHTATDTDEEGNPYVGLQITRDPGLIYVYSGFCVVAFGGICYLFRRVRGRR